MRELKFKAQNEDELKKRINEIELDEAHEQWLKEREEVLQKLQYTMIQLDAFGYDWCIERSQDLKDVYNFIKKGEI